MPSPSADWTATQTIWLAVIAATLPWLPYPAPRAVPPRDPSGDLRPPGSVFLYEETLEANAAAREDFEALPGVGPATARRLLEARDALGGFCSLDELRAAGRIPSSSWEGVRPRVRLVPPDGAVRACPATTP